MGAWLRGLLGDPRLYIGLQKGVGSDQIRYRCLDEAELKPGERVLDVGCGPAQYLDHLPDQDYVGFDTSEAYIRYARRRHGKRGDFRCETLAEAHLRKLGQFDAVLLFGVLHHLDDAQCAALLDLCARALAPGGRVVTFDPTLHAGQGRVARWMAEHDRGGYVRRPESYNALADRSFGDVRAGLMNARCRVPISVYQMRMASPLVASASLLLGESSEEGWH